MKSWNPVLNIVKDVLSEYRKKMNNEKSIKFEQMLEYVSEERSSFFDCLQMNQHGKFLLIRYGLAEMDKGMWTDEDSPYRECRSVVIDLEKERLVTCGFRKFFNMNEVAETQIDILQDKIANAKLFEVADKLDGSMQNARWYEGKVFMTGSMALDEEESWRLKNGKDLLTDSYVKMLSAFPYYTFTFEYISDKNPHVVDYKEDMEGLYLLGARDVCNGRQLSYKELKEIVEAFQGVKMVELENKSLEDVIEDMKNMKANEKEGWVLNIDGLLVKVKCDDYVNIHRILDRLASPNVIIQAIADETYDDLITRVPVNYRERVDGFADKIKSYVQGMTIRANKALRNAPDDIKDNRGNFMRWVSENVEKDIQPAVREKYLGKEFNFLKKGKEGYKRASEIGVSING